jgi:hypothetical protein
VEFSGKGLNISFQEGLEFFLKLENTHFAFSHLVFLSTLRLLLSGIFIEDFRPMLFGCEEDS